MKFDIDIGGIQVEVIKKGIKNIHLSVIPPLGIVRISAPLRMNIDTIRAFAILKIGWIRQQQKRMLHQERAPQAEYLNRESHYIWGKRYLLKIIESDAPPLVELTHNQICLRVRKGCSREKMKVILEQWYRAQLRNSAPPLIAKWERLMGVNVDRFFIQKMKTKWGSCSRASNSIRLNTDLAKKPPEYLEYIIVHEMAHLLEHTHNERFIVLMNRFMPKWKSYRAELNRLPI